MESVIPVGGSSGGPQAASSNTKFPINLGNVTLEDSIMTGQQISLLQAAFINSDATSLFLSTLLQALNQAAISRIPYYQDLVSSLSALTAQNTALVAVLDKVIQQQTDDANLVDGLNSGLSTYNTSLPNDQAAVVTMNQAIVDYNNGSITLVQYQAAVATYNNYISTSNQNTKANDANAAITTFNDQAIIINQLINDDNNQLPSGSPPFTPQDTYSTTTIQPLAPLDPINPVITNSTNYIPTPATITATVTFLPPVTDSGSYASTLLGSQVQLYYQGVLLQSSLSLKDQANFFFQLLFALAGSIPILPPSFNDPDPDISLSDTSQPGGSGSSVPLARFIASELNPLVSAIIESGIFSTLMSASALDSATSKLQATQLTAQQLAEDIGLIAVSFLAQIGLVSVDTATRLLGSNVASIDPQSSITALAVGLGNLSELNKQLSFGVISGTITNLVNAQFPDLSETDKANLAAQLTAGTEVVFTLTGILSVAIALNSPFLVGQLLGTLSNSTPALAGNLNLAPPFTDTLKNQQNAEEAAKTLADQANITLQNATAIINSDAVQSANNANDLQVAINQGLINLEADQKTANDASLATANTIQAQYLGQNVLQTQITNQEIAGTALANQGVTNFINQNGGTVTGLQLRDYIASQIQGASQSAALLSATQYVASIQPAIPPLTPAEIAANLAASVNSLNAPPIATANITNGLQATLLGQGTTAAAQSALDTLRNNINILTNLNDQKVNAVLADLVHSFVTPDLQQQGLSRLLGDPAKSLLYMASGLIYSPDQPAAKPASLEGQAPGGLQVPV